MKLLKCIMLAFVVIGVGCSILVGMGHLGSLILDAYGLVGFMLYVFFSMSIPLGICIYYIEGTRKR